MVLKFEKVFYYHYFQFTYGVTPMYLQSHQSAFTFQHVQQPVGVHAFILQPFILTTNFGSVASLQTNYTRKLQL